MSIRNQSTIAADSTLYSYGSVETQAIPVPAYRPKQPSIIPGKLNILVGDLIGLMFISLSTLYILLMPVYLMKSGSMKLWFDGVMKRSIDIIGASVGLLLSLPIMVVVAILVKLDSSGPVLYTQTRVGVNRRRRDRRWGQQVISGDCRERDRRREDYLGRPFKIVKFRTMVQDAEKKTGPVWACENDPRVTRLGRFLRKTRLDEFPQFWSILIGDMSLVGPRPERPSFVRDLCTKIDNYENRLEVKPGLTGLAQVENGYDSSLSSVSAKVNFDLQYIRSWTIWSDIRILAKTVVVVITGKGAC